MTETKEGQESVEELRTIYFNESGTGKGEFSSEVRQGQQLTWWARLSNPSQRYDAEQFMISPPTQTETDIHHREFWRHHLQSQLRKNVGGCTAQPIDRVLRKVLSQKLRQYKEQDWTIIWRNLGIPVSTAITNGSLHEAVVPDVLAYQKLIEFVFLENHFNCYYCRQKVKVLYERRLDPLQWTIDRLNNDVTHSFSRNIILACLKCNITRRNTPFDKFYSKDAGAIVIDRI